MDQLMVFSGPCVLENESLAMAIAESLKKQFNGLNLTFTFKGSFDKANRTSVNSYRGPGLEEGLKILEKIKKQFQIPVLTDFHYPEQAMAVAEVVDVLQVPAFLCRQTDMILAGAEACKKFSRILKVKKGQFLSPEETKNIVDKATHFIPKKQILLTERGSSFGYQNLVVDMASFQIMKSFGVKTVHDATHCVQRPGAGGDKTGGKREQVAVLAKAAMAAGADGVFIETHPHPEKALSDSATCLPLDSVGLLVRSLIKIREVSGE
jgi:2-dehydro-3-deoxyphosphooctonate aldolase (KDO 8-P synthase)